MSLLPYGLFVLVAAFVFAKLEIEIEGEHGWAQHLPTWRIEQHVLLEWFFGGRPLTGYHVWAFALVLVFFHLPFFWGVPWSGSAEARVFGGYVLFWLLEDFLWFLLNPHFGWRRFRRVDVWWHKRWLLGLPIDYWVAAAIVAALFWAA